jgi:hypothetical protein
MGTLVHTCLGSSYLIAHVLHCPPPRPAHSFIIGPAVINTHTNRYCSNKHNPEPASSLSESRGLDSEEGGGLGGGGGGFIRIPSQP